MNGKDILDGMSSRGFGRQTNFSGGKAASPQGKKKSGGSILLDMSRKGFDTSLWSTPVDRKKTDVPPSSFPILRTPTAKQNEQKLGLPQRQPVSVATTPAGIVGLKKAQQTQKQDPTAQAIFTERDLKQKSLDNSPTGVPPRSAAKTETQPLVGMANTVLSVQQSAADQRSLMSEMQQFQHGQDMSEDQVTAYGDRAAELLRDADYSLAWLEKNKSRITGQEYASLKEYYTAQKQSAEYANSIIGWYKEGHSAKVFAEIPSIQQSFIDGTADFEGIGEKAAALHYEVYTLNEKRQEYENDLASLAAGEGPAAIAERQRIQAQLDAVNQQLEVKRGELQVEQDRLMLLGTYTQGYKEQDPQAADKVAKGKEAYETANAEMDAQYKNDYRVTGVQKTEKQFSDINALNAWLQGEWQDIVAEGGADLVTTRNLVNGEYMVTYTVTNDRFLNEAAAMLDARTAYPTAISLDHMNDKQKDTYYYLLGAGYDAMAISYANECARADRNRKSQNVAGLLEDDPTQILPATVAYSLLFPFAGYDIMAGSNYLETGLNVNTNLGPAGYRDAIVSGASNWMNSVSGTFGEGVPVVGGKGLGDVYSTVLSGAESYGAAMAFGQFATIPLALSAASSTYNNAVARGIPEEDAKLEGLAAGGAEALFEYVSIGEFVDGKTSGGIIKDILKQGAVEGSEEVLTGIANHVTDGLINKDNSQFNQNIDRLMAEEKLSYDEARDRAYKQLTSDLIFEGLVGFATGSTMSTVKTVGLYRSADSVIAARGNTEASVADRIRAEQAYVAAGVEAGDSATQVRAKVAKWIQDGAHMTLEDQAKGLENYTEAKAKEASTQRDDSAQEVNPDSTVIQSEGTQAYLDFGLDLATAEKAGAVLDGIVKGEITAENMTSNQARALQLNTQIGVDAVRKVLGVEIKQRANSVANGSVMAKAVVQQYEQNKAVATPVSQAQQTAQAMPEVAEGQNAEAVQAQEMPQTTQPVQQPAAEKPRPIPIRRNAPIAHQMGLSYSAQATQNQTQQQTQTQTQTQTQQPSMTYDEFEANYLMSNPGATFSQVSIAYEDYLKNQSGETRQSTKTGTVGLERNEYSEQLDKSVTDGVDSLGKLFGLRIRFDDLGANNGYYIVGTNDVVLDIAPSRAGIGKENAFRFVIAHEIGHAAKDRLGAERWQQFEDYAVKIMGGEKAITAKQQEGEAYADKAVAREDVACDFIGQLLSDKATLDNFCEAIRSGEVQKETARGFMAAVRKILGKLRGKGIKQFDAVTKQLAEKAAKQFNTELETAENAVKAMQQVLSEAANTEKNTTQASAASPLSGQFNEKKSGNEKLNIDNAEKSSYNGSKNKNGGDQYDGNRVDRGVAEGVSRRQVSDRTEASERYGENGRGHQELPGVLRINDELDKAFKESGVVATELYDYSGDSAAYSSALDAARSADKDNGWCVTPQSAEDLAGKKLRMDANGSIGYVLADGDIEGVFKNPKTNTTRRALRGVIPQALSEGGTKLDCYGDGLVAVYEAYGFIPVARVEFNPEYANPGWDESKGRPFIYMMMHNGDSADTVVRNIGQYDHLSMDQLQSLPTYDKDGYDEAAAYRDSLLESSKKRLSKKSSPETTAYSERYGSEMQTEGQVERAQARDAERAKVRSDEASGKNAETVKETDQKIGDALKMKPLRRRGLTSKAETEARNKAADASLQQASVERAHKAIASEASRRMEQDTAKTPKQYLQMVERAQKQAEKIKENYDAKIKALKEKKSQLLEERRNLSNKNETLTRQRNHKAKQAELERAFRENAEKENRRLVREGVRLNDRAEERVQRQKAKTEHEAKQAELERAFREDAEKENRKLVRAGVSLNNRAEKAEAATQTAKAKAEERVQQQKAKTEHEAKQAELERAFRKDAEKENRRLVREGVSLYNRAEKAEAATQAAKAKAKEQVQQQKAKTEHEAKQAELERAFRKDAEKENRRLDREIGRMERQRDRMIRAIQVDALLQAEDNRQAIRAIANWRKKGLLPGNEVADIDTEIRTLQEQAKLARGDVPKSAKGKARALGRAMQEVGKQLAFEFTSDVLPFEEIGRLQSRIDSAETAVTAFKNRSAMVNAVLTDSLRAPDGSVLDVRSAEEILGCWKNDKVGGKIDEGRQQLLDRYMYLLHNADRMSAVDNARAAMTAFLEKHPDYKVYAVDTIRPDGSISSRDLSYKAIDIVEAAKSGDAVASEYITLAKAFAEAKNKPVFGSEDGRGLDATVSKIIAQQMEQKNPWLKQKAEEFYGWWDKFMQSWWVGIQGTQAQYDSMKKLYPHYVPTYRAIESGLLNWASSNRSIRSKNAVQAAKGSTLDLNTVGDNVARQVQNVINSALLDKLFENVYDAVLGGTEGISQYAVAGDIGARMVLENLYDDNAADPDAEFGKKLVEKMVGQDKDYYWTGHYHGEERSLVVNRLVFSALKSITNQNKGFNKAAKFGNALTKPMKTAITGVNIAFAARNIPRDFTTAMINSVAGLKYIAYYNMAIAKMFGDTGAGRMITSLMAKITNADISETNKEGIVKELAKSLEHARLRGSKEWADFVALGGTSSTYARSETGFLWNKSAKGRFRSAKDSALELLGSFNEATESMARFAEYLASIDMYGDTAEGRARAIKNAAEVTVDFSRHGRIGKVINAFAPYWNPGIQGMAKMYRSLRFPGDGKKVKGAKVVWEATKTLGKGAILFGVVPRLLQMAVLSLFGGEDEWEELSDRVKDTYFLIPKKDENGNPTGEFWKIPYNRDWGAIFGSTFSRIIQGAKGREDNWRDYWDSVIAGNFSVLPNFIGLTQWGELKSNKDFAGRSIIPYSIENGDVLREEAYTDDTSWFGKMLAKTPIGEALNLTPIEFDYLISSYLGDYGDMLIEATDADGINGLKGLFSDVIGNSFSADAAYSSLTMTRYYDMVDGLAQEVGTAKYKDPDTYKDTFGYEVQRAIDANYGELITELNQQIRETEDEDEKRTLKFQLQSVAQQALDFYERCMNGEIEDPVLYLTYEPYGDAIRNELTRLDEYNGEDYDYTFVPNPQAPKIGDHKNTDEEKAAYVDIYNRHYTEQVGSVMASLEYQNADDEQKLNYLEEARELAYYYSKQEFAQEFGIESETYDPDDATHVYDDLMDAGFTFFDAYEVEQKYKEIRDSDTYKTADLKASAYKKWTETQTGWTKAQRDAAFAVHARSFTSIQVGDTEKYDALTDTYNLSPAKAESVLLALSGKGYSDSQRNSKIVSMSGLTDKERYSVLMSHYDSDRDEKRREKIEAAQNAGIPAQTYVRVWQDMSALESDKDKNGESIKNSLKNKYAEYLRSATWLTDAQKNLIWAQVSDTEAKSFREDGWRYTYKEY